MMRHRIGVWRFEYDGGRLADVFHCESDTALDCLQAGPYDWQSGTAGVTRATFKAACAEWVRESSADYLRELPYLMG